MNDYPELPAFLKRPVETVEQAEARRLKYSRMIGPNRVLKNPSDCKPMENKND